MRVRLFFFCLIFSLAATLSAQTDTISPSDFNLDEVTVVERRASVVKSRISPLNTERVTGQELCKAACCNLSESFETSASVDVAYADAATGAKQIRLLGLGGTYVQLLTENTPVILVVGQGLGTAQVITPDLRGLSLQDCRSLLLAAHLTLGTVTYDIEPTDENRNLYVVYDQQPASGSRLTEGETVNINLSTDRDKAATVKPAEDSEEEFF